MYQSGAISFGSDGYIEAYRADQLGWSGISDSIFFDSTRYQSYKKKLFQRPVIKIEAVEW